MKAYLLSRLKKITNIQPIVILKGVKVNQDLNFTWFRIFDPYFEFNVKEFLGSNSLKLILGKIDRPSQSVLLGKFSY